MFLFIAFMLILVMLLYAGSVIAWALVRLAYAALMLFASLIILAFTAVAYGLSPSRSRRNRNAA